MERSVPRPSAFVLAGWLGVAAGCASEVEPAGAGGSGSTASASTSATTAAVASTGAGGAGGCGPSASVAPGPACATCTEASCCEEAGACAARPACADVAACIEGCQGDAACILDCSRTDDPAFRDLRACQTVHCFDACSESLACDDLSLDGFARDPAACDACVQSTCCEELAAVQSEEQALYEACLASCVDPSCLRDCELDHPGALPRQDSLLECLFGTCGPGCVASPGCGAFGFNGDPACSDCLEASCCDLWEACSFDASCLNYQTCKRDCVDVPTCQRCQELWPPEVAGLGEATFNCGSTACGDACGGFACGLVQGLFGILACRNCVEGECCDESTACGLDARCVGLLICSEHCDGDAACRDDCAERFPDAVELFTPLDACRSARCSEECELD